MAGDEDICWKLRLAASPARVYEFLSTDRGRASFWAESAVESDGAIEFVFPNGLRCRSEIIERRPSSKFTVRYIGGSETTFELHADPNGGCTLTLRDRNVPPADRLEVSAGWVSVLLQLKAAVDFNIDLRNHDRNRSWDDGFVEN